MQQDITNRGDSSKDSLDGFDAAQVNAVSNKAGDISSSPDGKTPTKASDVIPSGEDFSYPLLEEYLGDQDTRTGICTEAHEVDGNYGISISMCIDGSWYRSGGEVIVKHMQALLEDNRFPYEVDVKRITGKTGRTYYSL